MSAITAILASLCLRPSARDPTPHSLLLKTKAKVQFDRAVTERSKLFFSVFQPSNLAQFQPFFPVSTVRSAEGRKCESRAAQNRGPRQARCWLGGVEIRRATNCHRERAAKLPRVERSKSRQSLYHISANCQLLIASC